MESLDKEQDGFHKKRGSTQSLSRISQDILTKFNENQATFATFIDMMKASIQCGEKASLQKI